MFKTVGVGIGAFVVGALVAVFAYREVVPFPNDVVERGKAFEPENAAWFYQNASEVFPTRTVSRAEGGRALVDNLGRLDGFTYDYDGSSKTLDQLMTDTTMMGLAILYRGELVFEDYALGAGPGTRFTTFSAVKSITSTLVGAAVHDGLIGSVDDRLDAYISDLKGTAYEGVTIKQALQMSSGVRFDYEGTGGPGNDTLALLRDAVIVGKRRANEMSVSYPRAEDPGTTFNYNTAETQILLWLVREVTGNNASAYLEEKIWRPLGMDHDAGWIIDRAGPEGVEIGGAMFNASLRDLARIGLLMEQDGVWDEVRILPEGWVEAATVSTEGYLAPGAVHDPSTGRGYGYQWWTFDGGAFIADGAYGQTIYVDPSSDLVVARTSVWEAAWDKNKDLESLAAFKAIGAFLRNAAQPEVDAADEGLMVDAAAE